LRQDGRVAATALVLEGIYGVVALALPLIRARRRTGSSAVRLTPGGARVIQLLFTAANALVVAAPILDLSASLTRFGALDATAWGAIGMALAVVALPLIVVAQTTMGASWRIGVDLEERTELVSDGIFAYVRNPIYAAMVMFAVGVFLMVPNLASLAGAGLVVVAAELQTRIVEEPYLRRTHAAYEAYGRRTGRFLPGVGRLLGPGPTGN
jgi:protein-S-isoprenylcysteine O-methyltransferase Ste14